MFRFNQFNRDFEIVQCDTLKFKKLKFTVDINIILSNTVYHDTIIVDVSPITERPLKSGFFLVRVVLLYFI